MNEALTNITQIISILPTLIIYILPGYLIIFIKNFLLDSDNVEDKNILIKSIFLSYILINIEKFIIKLISLIFNIKVLKIALDSDIIVNNIWFIIITIAIAVMIGFLVFKFVMSEKWLEYNQKLGINRTLYKNIWDDIINPNNGPFIRVYLPNEKIIYDGKLKVYEHNKKENYFIAISNYKSYDNDNKVLLEDRRDDDKSWVVVNTKDISRYELFF